MTTWVVIGFLVLVGLMVAVDLGVLSRRPRAIAPSEGAISVQLWVITTLLGSLVLYKAYADNWIPLDNWLRREPDAYAAWLQFIGAYLVEVVLSLDNLAVLALLLAHFQVPHERRMRAVFWVLLASLCVRATLIAAGASVLHLAWTRWIFAAALVIGAVRSFVMPDEDTGFEQRALVKWARRVSSGSSAMAKWLAASPIALAVLVSSAADLSFALDSIPAVFSVTRDPFVAFVSNVLALMLLRSLYFALAGVIGRLRYLPLGMSLVLAGLAVKVAFIADDAVPTMWTVLSVVGVVGVSIAASLPSALRTKKADAGTVHEWMSRPTPLDDVTEAVAVTRRNLRKVMVLIAGTTVLIVAILIGPLPGPGFTIVAPIGIAILATEFVWARSLLYKLKVFQDKTDRFVKSTPVWWVPIVVIGFWLGLWGIGVLLHHYFEKVNTKLVFVLAGGGFVPVAFWAYRTVVMDFRRRGWLKPEEPGNEEPGNNDGNQKAGGGGGGEGGGGGGGQEAA